MNKPTAIINQEPAERALTKRVELLCRHYWATYEARNKTSVDRLMDAEGWYPASLHPYYIRVTPNHGKMYRKRWAITLITTVPPATGTACPMRRWQRITGPLALSRIVDCP